MQTSWSLEFCGTMGAGDDCLTLHYDDDGHTHVCFTPACYWLEWPFHNLTRKGDIYRDANSSISCTDESVLICFDGAVGYPRIEFALPRTYAFDDVIASWKTYATQRREVNAQGANDCE